MFLSRICLGFFCSRISNPNLSFAIASHIQHQFVYSVGSELDHKVKEAAAEGEEAWKVIGDKKGLFVWRVENFTIKPWPEERYGACVSY